MYIVIVVFMVICEHVYSHVSKRDTNRMDNMDDRVSLTQVTLYAYVEITGNKSYYNKYFWRWNNLLLKIQVSFHVVESIFSFGKFWLKEKFDILFQWIPKYFCFPFKSCFSLHTKFLLTTICLFFQLFNWYRIDLTSMNLNCSCDVTKSMYCERVFTIQLCDGLQFLWQSSIHCSEYKLLQ